MSEFRNISHVDASELFQVGRIEDIKKIEEFLEIYEVENRELFNQGLKLFVSSLESSLDAIDSSFENYFKDIFYSIERMDSGDCGKEEVEKKIKLISPKLIHWIFKNRLRSLSSQVEKTNNDELTLETQKWNPAQEILIEYIKECDLNVFEVEKIQDFIRNEIIALQKIKESFAINNEEECKLVKKRLEELNKKKNISSFELEEKKQLNNLYGIKRQKDNAEYWRLRSDDFYKYFCNEFWNKKNYPNIDKLYFYDAESLMTVKELKEYFYSEIAKEFPIMSNEKEKVLCKVCNSVRVKELLINSNNKSELCDYLLWNSSFVEDFYKELAGFLFDNFKNVKKNNM